MANFRGIWPTKRSRRINEAEYQKLIEQRKTILERLEKNTKDAVLRKQLKKLEDEIAARDMLERLEKN
jgi:hypothetical protein